MLVDAAGVARTERPALRSSSPAAGSHAGGDLPPGCRTFRALRPAAGRAYDACAAHMTAAGRRLRPLLTVMDPQRAFWRPWGSSSFLGALEGPDPTLRAAAGPRHGNHGP